MAYKHGVYISEADTKLVSAVEATSTLPVVVGVAPVHSLGNTKAPVNEPKLIYTMTEFVAAFGSPRDDEPYTRYPLYEAASLMLDRYKVSPLVCINVFDPAEHTSEVESESLTLVKGSALLAHGGVSALTLKVNEGSPLTENTDFSLNAGTGEISILEGGSLTGNETLTATYTYADPTKVTSTEVIGGVDETTLKPTGLSAVQRVFPLFRLVPGQILAPGFSDVPAVGIAIASACTDISGVFRAQGHITVPETLNNYTEAPAWLIDNGLTDSHLICTFGSPTYNGLKEHGDIHEACGICRRAAENDDIPFWSPSNYGLKADGVVYGDSELNLDLAQAAYLNGNGISTFINFTSSFVFWGDLTTAYPGVSDVKEVQIPVRMMFNWIGNSIILTAFQKVSSPLRRRLIETVCDTLNVWLNGLTAREFILGGRVEFLESENPSTDLMGGIARFHVYVTPPSAAGELDFTLEYDVDYLSTLFEAA